MKLASEQEIESYQSHIIQSGVKGSAVGVATSVGLGYYLRKTPFLRSMTPTIKTFMFLAPVLICGVTAVEWASLQFDMEQYDFGEAEKSKKEAREKIDALPTLERFKIRAAEHKYKIIVGAWAGSLAGSFWWINRDKLLSKSQKIVQARMYAQALTIVILLGSMIMSVNSASSAPKVQDPYSWQAIAAEEELREKAAGIPLRLKQKGSNSEESA